MCRHDVCRNLILLITCVLVMCQSVNSASVFSGGNCKGLYEELVTDNIRGCLKDSEKLKCLKNALKSPPPDEKMCKEILANKSGAVKKILSLLSDYKDKFSRTLAAEINKFLKQGGISITLGTEIIVNVVAGDNETVNVSFKFNNTRAEVTERKMKMNMNNILAMLFTPAMFIAGMMPWILPGIKMAVMMVTMMNNMAFSSALFALIRGYIFDTRPDDHIIYVNNGYKNSDHNHGNVPQKLYLRIKNR